MEAPASDGEGPEELAEVDAGLGSKSVHDRPAGLEIEDVLTTQPGEQGKEEPWGRRNEDEADSEDEECQCRRDPRREAEPEIHLDPVHEERTGERHVDGHHSKHDEEEHAQGREDRDGSRRDESRSRPDGACPWCTRRDAAPQKESESARQSDDDARSFSPGPDSRGC